MCSYPMTWCSAKSIFGRLLMTAALTQPSFTLRGGTNEGLRSVASKGLTPLRRLTRRLWSWRSEWGSTRQWRRQLGSMTAGAGADRLFESITERPAAL